MLRVIICDDNSEELNKVRQITEDAFRNSDIKVKVHTYLDVEQISNQMLSGCDIALLDVELENDRLNGIDLARKIRQVRQDTVIIFITNFIEYAPVGYEVQAFRYLLKRELESELAGYLQKAVAHLEAKKEILKIQMNGEIVDLLLEKILYMDVYQHNVTIHMQKDQIGKPSKTYTFYASLSELEEQLQNRGFLRIHKSYLVNMRHLKRFQCRQAELDNGEILRVSEKSYSEKKKEYLLWKGWQ